MRDKLLEQRTQIFQYDCWNNRIFFLEIMIDDGTPLPGRPRKIPSLQWEHMEFQAHGKERIKKLEG
jgi:hypothetical protein